MSQDNTDKPLNTVIPSIGVPFVRDDGRISEAWWRYLFILYQRTGGGSGTDLGTLPDQIARLEVMSGDLDMQAQEAFAFAFVQALGVQIRNSMMLGSELAMAAEQYQLRKRLYSADMAIAGLVYDHGMEADGLLHAVVTQTDNGFMSAADKTKLDGISATAASATLLADITTVNSTADAAVLTLTAPANTLVAGSNLSGALYGLISWLSLGGTFSVWIKLNGTKVLTMVFTLPNVMQTNKGFSIYPRATVRSVGTSGVLQLSSLMTSDGNALNAGPEVNSPAAVTINTTIANTIQLGWNWSTASTSNTVTAKNATLTLG